MKKLSLIFFLLNCIISLAQDKKVIENKIDILEKDCLNKENISNADMCNCMIKARESWDVELNKNYNLLKNKLPEKPFLVLKEAQKAWIEYRDKEFLFVTNYFYEVKEGSMWYPVSENTKKEMVKQRALELKKYLEMLDY